MKAEERTISQILTDQTCYEIPPYQRPYSWGMENVEQLLDDIREAFENKDPEYFIGSLITIEREKDRRYEVVDGQQRLTTLNLILARLRILIDDERVKADLEKRILPRNVYTGATETPRLTVRRRDQYFFRHHVLEGHPVPAGEIERLEAPQRHLAENGAVVERFCSRVSQQEMKLFADFMLTRVYVVLVTTPSWESAYRLFNVLNARGLPLSTGDHIKSMLFDRLGVEAATRSDELEARWLDLEELVTIDRMDVFLNHHRTSVAAARARRTLREEFAPLVAGYSDGPIAFLNTLISSARNYLRLKETDGFPGAEDALRSLHRVDHEEWIPPLLAFLNHPVPGLTAAEFIALLERITLQNWVRRLGPGERLRAFHQVIREIHAGQPAARIRQVFYDNARNEEFFERLAGELYGKPFDQAVLLRLEDASQDDCVRKTYGARLTIEHVMPQALQDEYWRTRFTEEEHARWLHRLGNLVLLSGQKNYKARHFDFYRKKEIYSESNRRVSFTLTQELLTEAEWSLAAITARQERLMVLARQIWWIGEPASSSAAGA